MYIYIYIYIYIYQVKTFPYLELSETSLMELFCNFFCKKAQS